MKPTDATPKDQLLAATAGEAIQPNQQRPRQKSARDAVSSKLIKALQQLEQRRASRSEGELAAAAFSKLQFDYPVRRVGNMLHLNF
jgi:hypothetical protein